MELGGPDYAKTAPKITDSEGNEVTDSRGPGYRYFGAAKQLPGVKELFEKEAPKQVRQGLEVPGSPAWPTHCRCSGQVPACAAEASVSQELLLACL